MTRRRDASLNDAPRRTTLTALIPAAVATAALAMPAGAAGASQVSVDFTGTLFFFAGVAPTVNQLTVGFDGTDYIVTDPGEVITPMANCTAVNANQVKCTGALVKDLDLRLGGLGDSALVEASVVGLGSQFDPGAAIQGEAGDDTITGGPNISNLIRGHDDFGDGPGNDILTGGSLEDTLQGSDGNDTLQGGGGRDFLVGGLGNDAIDAGAGGDSVDEGTLPNGADTIEGGSGDNRISYPRSGDVAVRINGVADDGESGEGDNVGAGFTSIQTGGGNDTIVGGPGPESIGSSAGNDNVSGGEGPDSIGGSDGDDTISGDGGNDELRGDAGNDLLNGGDGDDLFTDSENETGSTIGNDTYNGGSGLDRLSYEFSETAVTVDFDGVADDGSVGETDNAGVDLENLVGTAKADTLIGNDAANQIDAGAGNDLISGLAGPDALFGGDGDDSLDAGAGIDLLDSGAGADTLRSRDQDPDEVSCGSSVDTLLADSLDEFPATCDSFSLGAVITKPKVKLNEKGKGKIAVACPIAEAIDCAVTIEIGKGKPVAKGKGTVASGQTEKVKLKLTKAGKEANGNKLTGPATTKMTDAAGTKVSTFEDKVTLAR